MVAILRIFLEMAFLLVDFANGIGFTA